MIWEITMQSIAFSVFIILCYAGVVFIKCKVHPHADLSREDYLTNLNALRGLLALEIVIGHVVRYEKTILLPMGKFMICSVAFFFFVSAFGMAVSNEKKEKYLSYKFILNKPVYLLILAVVIFVFSMLVDAVCPNQLSYLTKLSMYGFYKNTNWYIWSQIIFYLIFFFIYKYLYRFHTEIICVTTVVMVVVMYFSGFSEGWLASSFAFPFGLIVGEHFDSITKYLFSKKGVITTVLLGVFGISSLFFKNENLLSMVFMRNAICLAAILVLMYLSRYITLGNNAVARFLNKYSVEIYLTQFVWLRLTVSYGWNYMIRMPIVIIATLVSSMLLHPIFALVKGLCK